MANKCNARVCPDGWHFYDCGRKATSADGTKCGIHDPERIAARKAKRGPTAFEREIQAIHKREKMYDQRKRLLDMVSRFADAYDHDGGNGMSAEFMQYARWLAEQGRAIQGDTWQ